MSSSSLFEAAGIQYSENSVVGIIYPPPVVFVHNCVAVEVARNIDAHLDSLVKGPLAVAHQLIRVVEPVFLNQLLVEADCPDRVHVVCGRVADEHVIFAAKRHRLAEARIPPRLVGVDMWQQRDVTQQVVGDCLRELSTAYHNNVVGVISGEYRLREVGHAVAV